MAFVAGFALCLADLILLHAIAFIMLQGSASNVLRGLLSLLGVGKFLIIGAAFYMLIVRWNMDGWQLFLGSLSGLVLYVSFLVFTELSKIRKT